MYVFAFFKVGDFKKNNKRREREFRRFKESIEGRRKKEDSVKERKTKIHSSKVAVVLMGSHAPKKNW